MHAQGTLKATGCPGRVWTLWGGRQRAQGIRRRPTERSAIRFRMSGEQGDTGPTLLLRLPGGVLVAELLGLGRKQGDCHTASHEHYGHTNEQGGVHTRAKGIASGVGQGGT